MHVEEPLELDVRGHLSFWGTREEPRPSAYSLTHHLRHDLPALTALATAWERGEPTSEPVVFSISRYGNEKCSYCGETKYATDGQRVWATQPCPYPDGLPVQVTLEVPSGRLFVANDLREQFPVANDDFYVNEQSEIKRCVEAYAQEGPMLHFFVGNSCPGVHRLTDEHVVVGTDGYDGEGEVEIALGGDCVDSVCTDLWWVSIVDADVAAERGLIADGVSSFEVGVVPGTYVLDYHALRRGFERYPEEGVTVFASLYREGTTPERPTHWPAYAR